MNRYVASKKHRIFYDINSRTVGRVMTKSNLKSVGSDNAVYFGMLNNQEIINIFKKIFFFTEIEYYQKHKYTMTAYGLIVDVETNLNSDGQIQLKVCGDGTMNNIFKHYQVQANENERINEGDSIVILFEFKEMKISLKKEIDFDE